MSKRMQALNKEADSRRIKVTFKDSASHELPNLLSELNIPVYNGTNKSLTGRKYKLLPAAKDSTIKQDKTKK